MLKTANKKTTYFYKIILDWLVPKQTEMSLFVFALAFALTWALNASAWIDVLSFMNDDSGDGIAFVALFVLSVFIVTIAGFLQKRVWGQKFFSSLFFVYANLIISYAYVFYFSEQNSFLSILLSAYHFSIGMGIVILYRVLGDDFDKRMPNVFDTNKVKILAANVFLFIVFFFFYKDGHPTFWQIPITSVMFFWGMYESVIRYFSETLFERK